MPQKRATKVLHKDAPKTTGGLITPGIDEINVPPDSFDGYIRCIFGQKGIGKSTLVSGFPQALTLMFEPRRRNLAIRQINLQKQIAKDIRDGAPDVWSQVLNTVDEWIDDDTISCINFDSVDIFYECCYHSILASNNINAPSEAGKSSSDVWNQIRDEWSAFFDTLAGTRLGINFVSHVKGRETEQLDGTKLDIQVPSCTPACLQYIKQACDYVFYYGFHNGKRAIQLRDPTGMAWVAVGTPGRFLQPDGKPVNILEMPDLAAKKTGYQQLVEAFENKHWDIDTPEDERGPAKKGPPVKKGPPRR